jgi:hypothetical protein
MIGYITAIGFLTFGRAASGLVLNNYAASDVWMSTSRIAVVIALIFSYPLAFQGCRDGISDVIQLIQPQINKTPTTLNIMTIVLLIVLTTLAAALKDVSFVLALGGGNVSSKCIFIWLALFSHAKPSHASLSLFHSSFTAVFRTPRKILLQNCSDIGECLDVFISRHDVCIHCEETKS